MMKILSQYLQKNKQKVKEIFDANSKEEQLPATKVFAFLQQILTLDNISFTKDGKEFFKSEDNQGKTEKIIQKYFKTTPDGKSKKFYLYRINFSFQEFQEFMEYWLKIDKSINIQIPLSQQVNSEQKKQQKPTTEQYSANQSGEKPLQASLLAKTEEISLPPELRNSSMVDNQFLVEQEKRPMLIAAYQGEIKRMQETLLRVSDPEQSRGIEEQIQGLKDKIQKISKLPKTDKSIDSKDKSKGKSSLSPKKPKTQGPKQKKPVNFKTLFEYYAKQNHLTGVKLSFQKIEHESQTINYQKLVHFLKEYQLFPQKASSQKKLHNLYVRSCSISRDLHFNEFMQMLIKLPDIVITSPEIPPEQRFQAMVGKIQSKDEKNKVLFHYPFHSQEKDNFRVDKGGIKYEFKLKPLKGKLISEVGHQLETRKKEKEDLKMLHFKEKEDQKIRKVKKLMAIDPYHPFVIKNADLLRQKSHSAMSPPVANMNNMQKFRDASFDMKARFGIADFDEDPLKPSNRYDMDKRLQMIEREQSLKMSSLMSGLIERSQAKMAKLGLSPRKNKFSKFNQ